MRAADVAHGRIEDLHTSKYKGIPLRVLQRMLPQRPGFAGVAEAAMSIAGYTRFSTSLRSR